MEDEDTRAFRRDVRKSLTCLHDSFQAYKKEDEAWKHRFEPFLVAEIQSKEDREKFFRERKRAIAARVFDAFVYGGFIAMFYTLYHYRDALKALKDLS
jgi:hypothetical protein